MKYYLHLKFLILMIFYFTNLSAQKTTFFGKAEPGGIMIGTGNRILAVYLGNTELSVDKTGMFVFGFDRDATGTQSLKIIYKEGRTETKKFVLPQRKYVTQRLKIADKYVTPPFEELERIDLEAQKMKDARAEVGKLDSALFAAGFEDPVKDSRISGVFGSQRILNSVPKSPHNGIDFAADEGTFVYAVSEGIVRIAGENFYYNGNFVLLDHGQGLTSVYLHMSKLDVKSDDRVIKGQKIGEVGSTGRSTSAHLHWGVQWYNKRIDPMSLLKIKF